MKHFKSINQWALEDKPRERLELKGKQSLSNSELLAIILRSGIADSTALDLAKDILQLADHQLHKLAELNIEQLSQIKGVGNAKAIEIIACLEIARRYAPSKQGEVTLINSSLDAYHYFYPELETKLYEEFWILLLNRRNQVIKPYRISEGGVSGTLADPKKIFKAALENNASGIILCHNHPSGNLKPSTADKRLTIRISDAAAQLDIQLIDHLIIALGGYYSFADDGQI
ncbi:MAG: DNA repair protein RadC [Bacteroidia bacterium]